MEEEKKIIRSAIRTLAFFDIFGRALTLFELWQGLDRQCEYKELEKCLAEENNRIKTLRGFYFLPGREGLAAKRLVNYNLQNKKIKIAQRAGNLLRFIVGVKMIAICNNFSYQEDSDIDFFIITAKNRLWLSRFWITVVLFVFGFWRHGKKVKDRICLSFYISEEAMATDGLLLKNVDKDIYFYYWLSDLLPIYDSRNYFQKFWEKNSWLKQNLPNSKMPSVAPHWRVKDTYLSLLAKKFDELWFDSAFGFFLERIIRFLQLQKMKQKINLRDKGNTAVVISDTVLKFHEADRRQEYYKRWSERIQKYL